MSAEKHNYTMVETGDKLLILLSIPKVWFALLPWGGATVFFLCMAFNGTIPLLFGILGLCGILLIVWNFLREAAVEVSDQSITMWDDIIGIRLRKKCYLADNIRELRLFADTTAGQIAFDHGLATVTFGKSLNPDEAEELLVKIKNRFPVYQLDHNQMAAHLGQAYDGALGSSPGDTKAIKMPSARHKSELLGDGLRITIPSMKQWLIMIFLVFWLAIWTSGGIFAVGAAIRGRGGVILIVFCVFWVVFEILTAYHLLWLLFGREIIEVRADTITIRQAILGIGRPKVYAREHIDRIRADVEYMAKPYPLADEGVSINKGTGAIAFKYKEQTIRMGIGLDEAEAKYLIAKIQSLYPMYKNRNS